MSEEDVDPTEPVGPTGSEEPVESEEPVPSGAARADDAAGAAGSAGGSGESVESAEPAEAVAAGPHDSGTGDAAPATPATPEPAPRRRVGGLVGAAALAAALLVGSFALGRATADNGGGERHHRQFGPYASDDASRWDVPGPFRHGGRGDGNWGPGRTFPNAPRFPDGRHQRDRNDDDRNGSSNDSNSSSSSSSDWSIDTNT
jgi:hypothetical protein